jgi:hypothetical protein
MLRRICLACTLAAIALTLADAKPARKPLEPEPPPKPRQLEGTYRLSHKNDAARIGLVALKIWGQQGNTFQVGIDAPTGNPGIDWEGRGVINGDQGYYDWVFPDGKRGRTTFTVDKDGVVHGQVRGGGIDWDYVGIRSR